VCQHCSKIFSSRQSRSIHIKKFHQEETTIPEIQTMKKRTREEPQGDVQIVERREDESIKLKIAAFMEACEMME
jgi:hypothetical protein